ncbi:50S ribosomal protein L5 [Candidatus Parcubacteria bacterium]|nr:MAG: 50S ribosomal protein L5 [Candidatus Parcubacteria bacterium]GIW68836.1 MAG: 50S ribosomal protein L5 [Candidatus Parcubacteria bacterium]
MPTPTIHKTKERAAETFASLKGVFGWRNALQAPRLEKIVVSVGTGRVASDKMRQQFIAERLSLITGQKAVPTKAKKAIASFKTRKGLVIGWKVTLRKQKMWEFLDKVIHIALPRTRDFHGIDPESIDPMGNLTIGIPEHTAFPEAAEDELKDIFGLGITLVSTARTKEEAEAFFRHLGVPLKKRQEK